MPPPPPVTTAVDRRSVGGIGGVTGPGEQLGDAGERPESSRGVRREEDLGRLTVGDLRERLEVLDGDEVVARVSVVDGGVDEAGRVGLTLGLGLTAEALRLGELSHSERLTLGVEDLALPHR